MPRSLRLRLQYIPTVKSSLLRNGFPSQKILAEDLGIAQSTVSHFLNGKPVDYANFIEICRGLNQEWRDIADFEDKCDSVEIQSIAAKIAILFEGFANAQSSQNNTLVQQLHQALTTASHQVFLVNNSSDSSSYLKICDYLILIICEEYAASEMILEQVQLAKELHNLTAKKLAILPIWVELNAPFSFDLLNYLAGIQSWQWRCVRDSSQLISEILTVVKEGRISLNADHELAVKLSKITNTQQAIIQPLPAAAPELPGGQVDLASRFYIDRPPIESRCYETIVQPGALIRIKAPRQMGKTSLMARILHHAEQQGCRTVALSFQLANRRVFASSDTFLQWFCASIGQELGMLEQLPKCWELADLIGSNQCCKAYFEQYLLSESSPPLTLGLDECDRLFESPEIADDFFGLLRALHEEAKRRDIWKKFRLIVVHSTEVYIPLDMNKSPFNVGLPIELPEFNLQEVQDLAKRHGLSWSAAEVAELMGLVGGNPYLVRLGMYHISRQDVTLDRLVKESATEAGIYSDHLRRHLWNLEKYGELMEGMREVTSVSQPVRLRSELGFKLNSMGLVKLDGNHCIPRCRLYEEYFGDRLNGK
ncbi:MAG: molecular chaperone Tir [Oscillatoriales cyanobacterium]|uniref:AAA-like domain-containing protein n=1 Tax=Microcoleus anatoxicus TaxID=2705319 RepID=UPI002979B05C|nr:MAG: molecular chaperone Tir [Oscillatoriales cyanobacterium]TAE05195.1 MAG: molecular chaperone Tir [Oscillatoriales cyanobacterium]